jgi:hypothetical protein
MLGKPSQRTTPERSTAPCPVLTVRETGAPVKTTEVEERVAVRA